MDETLNSCLDLLRRLPPQNVEANLATLVDLCPDLADDLLGSVDQPLKVQSDSTGKQFLVCDYNREGDSYRSPWTNEFLPPLAPGEEGETAPTPKLRQLEVAVNEAFDVYRDMYYEGGVSSAYLWDLGEGFAGVILLKKSVDVKGSTAVWDSIHVFETVERGRTAHYKLTSTVMLYMVRTLASSASDEGLENRVALAGSLTRQSEVDAPLDPSSTASTVASHVSNLGKFVEDQEGKMRNSLQEVYFSKTRDIVNSVRSAAGFGEAQKMQRLQGELVGLLGKRSTAAAS